MAQINISRPLTGDTVGGRFIVRGTSNSTVNESMPTNTNTQSMMNAAVTVPTIVKCKLLSGANLVAEADAVVNAADGTWWAVLQDQFPAGNAYRVEARLISTASTTTLDQDFVDTLTLDSNRVITLLFPTAGPVDRSFPICGTYRTAAGTASARYYLYDATSKLTEGTSTLLTFAWAAEVTSPTPVASSFLLAVVQEDTGAGPREVAAHVISGLGVN